MPVELRKRKTAPAAPEPPAKKPSKPAAAKAASKTKETVKEAVKEKPAEKANGAPKAGGKPEEGDVITLEGFGGEVETHDGTKTTLKALVDESKAGVVIFTYPKASTPGCNTQACLFRDSYEPLTAGGLAIYGLSRDSPKLNAKWKENKNLPYTLLCDPKATLIGAIGFKKPQDKTQRGVFVVDKAGKVLAVTPGGPAATVDVVKEIVESLKDGAEPATADGEPKAEEAEAKDKTEKKTEEKPTKDEEAKKEDGINGEAKEEDEKADEAKKDE